MNTPGSAIQEHRGGCPEPLHLSRFAAGLLESREAGDVMRHIVECAECVSVLKQITTPAESDLSADELAAIENLPSATAAGRRSIARKMAGARYGWQSALRIAAAVAGIGIVAGGFWYGAQVRGRSAQGLVATAYSRRRPFAYRLTGGGSPGPIRISRSQAGLTDLPSEVVTAISTLDQELSRRTHDVKLLNALGQAKLLALDLDGSVAAFERARELSPTDESVKANLAIVWALRAEQVEAGESSHPLANKSLALLDSCLRARPSDSIARFNRATILKALGRNAEAAAEFQICLHDEPDPAWRQEILKQLQALQL